MNHYDLGRGYGGAGPALARVEAQVTIAGISSDRLYPLRLQWELAELVPGAGDVRVIDSASATTGSSWSRRRSEPSSGRRWTLRRPCGRLVGQWVVEPTRATGCPSAPETRAPGRSAPGSSVR